MYGPLVLGEEVAHEEALRADLALETFAGVTAHVGLEVIALGEGRVTVRTLVGLLTRVRSHMYGQVVRPTNTHTQLHHLHIITTNMVIRNLSLVNPIGQRLARSLFYFSTIQQCI